MEDVLIVFIVFSFITLFCGGIYKLIRAKMDRTGIDEDTFDRLAKAFVEHRKESNQRIEHLESIIREGDSTQPTHTKIEDTSSTIEVEDKNQRTSSTENSSSLRNMLHEE